ncbi:DUF6042 family protein [Streptomyces clavifer]|uniref:DUF6042 family protein n=1 Tax=Streptomyces clavifer TaxID=68188 RepID=UPI0037A25660
MKVPEKSLGERARWTLRTGPLVDILLNYLGELGDPQEVRTSLDRLAAATGLPADDVRIAVAELVKDGDARVQRGREPADADAWRAHCRFRLDMDWEHFHESRMQLSRAGDDT